MAKPLAMGLLVSMRRNGLVHGETCAFRGIEAAADTVMNRPSAELLAEVFPGVPLTREVGEFGTLLAIDRARQVLGFEPRHSWRDHVPADATPSSR